MNTLRTVTSEWVIVPYIEMMEIRNGRSDLEASEYYFKLKDGTSGIKRRLEGSAAESTANDRIETNTNM